MKFDLSLEDWVPQVYGLLVANYEPSAQERARLERQLAELAMSGFNGYEAFIYIVSEPVYSPGLNQIVAGNFRRDLVEQTTVRYINELQRADVQTT